MSPPPILQDTDHASHPLLGRRHAPECEPLLLTELNPYAVVDHVGGRDDPIELLSFGIVREPCPKCHKTCLNLILRQDNVRTAHLLCPDCRSCYDAHYAGGAPALTI